MVYSIWGSGGGALDGCLGLFGFKVETARGDGLCCGIIIENLAVVIEDQLLSGLGRRGGATAINAAFANAVTAVAIIPSTKSYLYGPRWPAKSARWFWGLPRVNTCECVSTCVKSEREDVAPDLDIFNAF